MKGLSRQVKKKLMNVVLMLIGLCVVIGSILNYSASVEVEDGYIQAKAQILDIEKYDLNKREEHRVLIRYSVDNEVYSRTLDYYDSSLQVGDEINIAYNEDSILDIVYVDRYKTNSIALIVLGTIVGSIGLTGFIKGIHRNSKYSRGKAIVLGDIIEITQDVASSNEQYIVVVSLRNPKTGMMIEIQNSLTADTASKFSCGDVVEVVINLDEDAYSINI